MKVIIAYQEKSLLIDIEKLLSQMDGIEVAGAFHDTADAYRYINANAVDIVFSEISVPAGGCLDFARKIAEEHQDVQMVFISEFRNYALEAFDVGAADYILKPVAQERIERAVKRIRVRQGAAAKAKPEESEIKLYVYGLGGMELKDHHYASVQLSSAKSYELLAYLLVHKGRFVSKWNVIEDIFGDMPVGNAETYLNTTTYKLRKSLEQYGLKEAVITANESYKIDIRSIYTDFIDFESKVGSFKKIDASNIDAACAIETLFSGELFIDKEYNWAFHDRERLTDLYLDLAKKIVVFLLDRDVQEAIKLLKKMFRINELDEEVNCLLMRAYSEKRDLVSLVRQFNRYTKALRSELGIAPGKYLFDLYASLKTSIDKLEAN